jgi:hypothetical protein
MFLEPQNAIERKRRLFEKARSNLQRRSRESLLSALPNDLRDYLQHAECIYTPDSHELISNFHPARANGIGYQALILFGVPSVYELEGKLFLVPDVPLFCINFG